MPWFRNKRIGYGWSPASWQGWAITLLGAAILFGLIFLMIRAIGTVAVR